MTRIFFTAVLTLVLLAPGCAQIKNVIQKDKGGHPTPENELIERELWPIEPQISSQPFVKEGKILDFERLEKGGKLQVLPFGAGVDVEIDEQLDQVALGIIKGSYDFLEGNEIIPFKGKVSDPQDQEKYVKSRFNVVFDRKGNNPELVLEGRITAMKTPSKIKRLVLRSLRISLDVEGSLVDRRTGEILLVFKDSIEGNTDEHSFSDLGYQVGVNIARFCSQLL